MEENINLQTKEVIQPPTPPSPSPTQTRSSKILITVMAVVTTLSLIYVGYLEYQKTKLKTETDNKVLEPQIQQINSTPSSNSSTTYTRINTCSAEECLFVNDEAPEGYAKIKGYYYAYESEDFGVPVSCQGFVVTGGSDALIKHFNELIEVGNNLNKIIDEKLIINLKIDALDNETSALITSSNINKQIELGVIRTSPQQRGASSCASYVDIVTAK